MNQLPISDTEDLIISLGLLSRSSYGYEGWNGRGLARLRRVKVRVMTNQVSSMSECKPLVADSVASYGKNRST